MRELVYDYVGIERGDMDGGIVREGLPIDSTSLSAHLAGSLSASEGLVVSKGLKSADSLSVPVGSGSVSSSTS